MNEKVSVDVQALRSALSFTSKTIEPRNTIPIIALAHFEVKSGQLKITTTCLDQWASETIECESDSKWSFLVNTRVLARLISGLKGVATFERTSAEGVSIQVDGTTYSSKLVCDVAEFPMRAMISPRKPFEVGEAELFAGLRHAQSCISKEETRYYLNGIFFERLEDTTLRMVATDGHRIGVFDVAASIAQQNLSSGGILPRKAVVSLAEMVGKMGNRPARLRFFGQGDLEDGKPRETGVEITVGDRTLVSKLIDGSYPDYRRVLVEQPGDIDVTVNDEALRRVMALQSNRDPVRLSPGQAALFGRSSDGQQEIKVPITANNSDGDDIGFRGQYLKDMTAVHGTVRVKGKTSADPVTVTPEDPRGFYVLMPMRL